MLNTRVAEVLISRQNCANHNDAYYESVKRYCYNITMLLKTSEISEIRHHYKKVIKIEQPSQFVIFSYVLVEY